MTLDVSKFNCKMCETNTDCECDIVLNSNCHIQALSHIEQLDADLAASQTEANDLRQENAGLKQMMKEMG